MGYIRSIHIYCYRYVLTGYQVHICTVYKYIVQVHSFTQRRSLVILLPADIPWAAQLEHVMLTYHENCILYHRATTTESKMN